MRRVHDGPRGPGVTQDPLPSDTGSLAGTDDPHRFEPLSTLGTALCAHCYGFSDDYRHYLPPAWQCVEDEVARRYEEIRDILWEDMQ